MDCSKVGALIYQLRKEKGMTQREVAAAMHISDKTISKWERGFGCPDVSLLTELASILDVQLETLLSGELQPNEMDGGNMKRTKFYVCPTCGNILTGTGAAEVTCCGRPLTSLQGKAPDPAHALQIETIEDEYYITFSHDMSKMHFLTFFAYVTCNSLYLLRLYPEQSGELRIPRMRGGTLYYACTKDGMFMQRL